MSRFDLELDPRLDGGHAGVDFALDSNWFEPVARALEGADTDFNEELGEFGGWVSIEEDQDTTDAVIITLTLADDSETPARTVTRYRASIEKIGSGE